jgi:hypothetical protein
VGYLVDGKCVDQLQAALDASCARFPVSQVVGGDLVTFSCEGTSVLPQQLILSRVLSSDPAASSVSQAVSFASCDALLPFTDSVSAWSLMLGAIVVVALTRSIYIRILGNH